MITEIGIVAGEIWNYLDSHGEVSFSELVSGVDKPKDLILMSLGWLAREGHVLVRAHDDSYQVALRCEKV
jgi:hypothetical protein